MDPISIIVAALALGAAAGLRGGDEVIKREYADLKLLIRLRFGPVNYTRLEGDPVSKVGRSFLKQDLLKLRVDKNERVLRQAEKLIGAVLVHAPKTAEAISVDTAAIETDARRAWLNRAQAAMADAPDEVGATVMGPDIAGALLLATVTVLEGPKGLIDEALMVSATKTTLGRQPSLTDISFYPDEKSSISRIHATIELGDDNVFRLTDANSTAATRLNGRKISPDAPVVLADGDEIVLGDLAARGVKLRFNFVSEGGVEPHSGTADDRTHFIDEELESAGGSTRYEPRRRICLPRIPRLRLPSFQRPTLEDLALSITHPRLLSKGRSSRFVVRIFPSGQQKMVEEKIEQERKERDLQEHVGETELTAGLSVVVALASNALEFQPEKIVKRLKEKINAFEFSGTPKNDCVPGQHPVRLSITDEETSHEYDYEPRTFDVAIVDFAFDHVSRPLLLKAFSGLSFLTAVIMGTLTFLGQVDKALGWPAGTAFVFGGGFLGQRFWSQYRRVTEEQRY